MSVCSEEVIGVTQEHTHITQEHSHTGSFLGGVGTATLKSGVWLACSDAPSVGTGDPAWVYMCVAAFMCT